MNELPSEHGITTVGSRILVAGGVCVVEFGVTTTVTIDFFYFPEPDVGLGFFLNRDYLWNDE